MIRLLGGILQRPHDESKKHEITIATRIYQIQVHSHTQAHTTIHAHIIYAYAQVGRWNEIPSGENSLANGYFGCVAIATAF